MKTCKCGAPRRRSGNDCLGCNAANNKRYRARKKAGTKCSECARLRAEIEYLRSYLRRHLKAIVGVAS